MRYLSTNGTLTEDPRQAAFGSPAAPFTFWLPEDLEEITEETWLRLEEEDWIRATSLFVTRFFPQTEPERFAERLRTLLPAESPFKLQPLNVYERSRYLFETWHSETGSVWDVVFGIVAALAKEMAASEGKEKVLFYVAAEGTMPAAAQASVEKCGEDKLFLLHRGKALEVMQRALLKEEASSRLRFVRTQMHAEELTTFTRTLFAEEELAREVEEAGYFPASLNSDSLATVAAQTAVLLHLYLCLRRERKAAAQKGESEPGERETCLPLRGFDLAAGEVSLDFSLASCYARAMGLPLFDVCVGNNLNRSAAEFLRSGRFNACHRLMRSMTPELDRLMPVNLERFVFEICLRDEALAGRLLEQARTRRRFELPKENTEALTAYFRAAFVKDPAVYKAIQEIYERFDQWVEPAVALCFEAFRGKYKSASEERPLIYLSLQSPHHAAFQGAKALQLLPGKRGASLSLTELTERMTAETGIALFPYAVGAEEKESGYAAEESEIPALCLALLRGQAPDGEAVETETGVVREDVSSELSTERAEEAAAAGVEAEEEADRPAFSRCEEAEGESE